MGIPTNYPGLTPEMVNLIKGRAYSLSKGYGHIPEDREDMEQDMALHLLDALSSYDPEKSNSQTFANRVIEYWTTVHIGKQRAVCRDYRRVGGSLDDFCVDEEGEGTTLLDILNESDALGYSKGLGCIEAVELKIDVERIMKTLDPELQAICRVLMTQSVTDVSRSFNIPRSTIAFHVRKIRKAFEREGLG